MVEVRDVAPGLWLWRQPHPDWRPGLGWDPPVSSFCATAADDVVVMDALAPPDEANEVWERFERARPTVAVVLKPDHVRSVDLFVERYGVRAFGPGVFHRGDVPQTELEETRPGLELAGGIRTLYDGRYQNETPLYLPDQRALVFADAMTAPGGVLRIWATPWHEERVLPAFRAMLELPFELVLVSHGEPVHDRAEFEAALEREPWEG